MLNSFFLQISMSSSFLYIKIFKLFGLLMLSSQKWCWPFVRLVFQYISSSKNSGPRYLWSWRLLDRCRHHLARSVPSSPCSYGLCLFWRGKMVLITSVKMKVSLECYHKECVPMTITIIYIFFVSLKFGVCYITGQWGKFKLENATLCVRPLFWHFVGFIKKMCFYHFHFFFDEVSNFFNFWIHGSFL